MFPLLRLMPAAALVVAFAVAGCSSEEPGAEDAGGTDAFSPFDFGPIPDTPPADTFLPPDALPSDVPADQTVPGLADAVPVTLSAQPHVTLPAHPVAVAIVSVDGDAVPELVIGTDDDGDGGGVWLLTASGALGFGAPEALFTGAPVLDLLVRDVNGDMAPDIVFAHAAGDSVPDGITVLINGADGWTALGPLGAGGRPARVTAADLDADGLREIVGAPLTGGPLSTWHNLGDAGFADVPVTYAMTDAVAAMAAAHFDADDREDIVLAVPDSIQATARLLLAGEAVGDFVPPFSQFIGVDPRGLAVADLDGNGRQDIVAAIGDIGGAGGIAALIGNGNGTLRLPHYNGLDFESVPVGVALGDLDGDSIMDLAVGDEVGTRVLVALGLGDGEMGDAKPQALDAPPTALAVGDLDGDGFADLVVTTESPDGYVVVGVTPSSNEEE